MTTQVAFLTSVYRFLGIGRPPFFVDRLDTVGVLVVFRQLLVDARKFRLVLKFCPKKVTTKKKLFQLTTGRHTVIFLHLIDKLQEK